MQVDLSIIILNYCSFNETQSLVSQLVSTEENIRIIIVDNNSPDGSYKLLVDRFGSSSDVDIIQNQRNTGYAAGNNVGIRYALEKLNSPYIAIMNPDVEITENFLRSMITYLEADQKIGAITGIMLDPHKSLNLASIACKIPSKFDDFIICSELLKFIYNPIKYNKFSNPSLVNPNVYYVDLVPGSCFVIRSTVLEKIGLLDEGTFLYCEERILARKIKDLGLTNAISLNDTFIHNHTLEQNLNKRNLKQALQHYYWLSASRLYYNRHYRNLGKMLYIYLPLLILPISLGFAEVALLHFLYRMQQLVFNSIVK